MITIHVVKHYGSSTPAAAAAPSRYKRRKRMSKLITTALLGLVLGLVMAPAAMAQTASVEGESFTHPRGTAVVHDQMYSGGAALKFKKSKAVATKQVTITEPSNVTVRARADQEKGGSLTLTIRVDGANAGTRTITSSELSDYLYSGITLQPGTYTIGLKGGNLATGRNVFVDVVSFTVADTSAPVVNFTSEPTSPTNRVSSLFRWNVTDNVGVTGVQCREEFTPAGSSTTIGRYANCINEGQGSYHDWVVVEEDGTIVYKVTARDAAGNETVTRSQPLVVDLIDAPTIDSPTTGATVSSPVTFTGSGSQPGNLISIQGRNPGGSSFEGAQTEVAADGTWSLSVSPLQGDGQYEFWAFEHESSGYRISLESAHVSLTVSTPPS
jgi:hypothetical protein